ARPVRPSPRATADRPRAGTPRDHAAPGGRLGACRASAPTAPPESEGADVTPFVVPLTAVGRDDLALAGGKGANLGELIAAGLPVPDGFVVTTAAYAELIDRCGIAERIPRLLDAGDGAGIRAE